MEGTLTVYCILEGDLHAAWTASILEALNLCLLTLLLSGVICVCRASLTKHVQQWLRPSHHDVLSLSAQSKNKKTSATSPH